jgi:hypothetical protein
MKMKSSLSFCINSRIRSFMSWTSNHFHVRIEAKWKFEMKRDESEKNEQNWKRLK